MSWNDATEILTIEECWALLDRDEVGRLAVDVGGHPDVFPVNYVVDDGSIVFKTGAGTKFAAAVLSRDVAFEIDGREPETRTVWSVVAKGVAHEVDDMMDRFDAEDLPHYPWVAEQKPSYVRITPEVVTGRRFHVVDSARLEPAGSDRSYHPGEPRLHPD